MKQKALSILFALACLSVQAVAQTRQVDGTVTSATDGTPIAGVSVSGGGAATQTDEHGIYSIEVPADGTLAFSYLGFASQRVPVDGRSIINVALEPGETSLDEVVVTGYGTQRKREVTGSITSIKGAEFANVASPSLDKSLQGLAAGVQASATSGILGQPARIRVRGVSSISSSSEPLYVVDGVPFISGDLGGVFYNNPLSSLNPNDIQNVEILKDGAATAIYGSRAAGGVILITTKSGSSGKTTATYDNWFAYASPSKRYDLMNAAEFIEIANEKLANLPTPAAAAAFPTVDPQTGETYDTDWQKVALRTAFQQNHALSLSGGTDKTTYYFSGGFTDMQGISLGNSQKKYNIRGRVDQKTWEDRLTIGLNTAVSYVEDRGFNDGVNALSGNIYSALVAFPNVPAKWADGAYNLSANKAALGPGANTRGIDGSFTNVLYTLDHNIYKSSGLHFNGNAYADLEVLHGLNLKTQIATQYIAGEDYMFWNPEHGDGRTVNGRIYQYYLPSFRYNWQNTLSYKVDFGSAGRLDLIGGLEYEKTRLRNFFAHGTDLSHLYFAENENIISGSLTNQLLGGAASERAFQSFFGRANYVLSDRYFLSATLRHDKISSLPHGNQGATLPGASIGWDVAREDFFTSGLISQFKVRGGYAEVGNTNIGSYPYAGTFRAVLYGENAGLRYYRAGNPDLKFETSKKINAGVDLAFLNDRITFSADFFRNDIDNMILEVPTPPSLGVPDNKISQNVGRMYNKGIEFAIGGSIISNENFSWNTNLNATFLKNRIQELYNGNDITYNYHINREGESVGSFYGYKYYGVNPQNGNAVYDALVDGSSQLVQYVPSVNAYRLYDPNDPTNVGQAATLGERQLLGNGIPTWYGGFNNTLYYKGFDLSVNMAFSGGNKVYNLTRQEILNGMDFRNAGRELLGRWTTPGQQTDVPRVVYGRGNAMNLEGSTNSRFLENGNFLRMRAIGLGYSFKDTPFLKTARISNLRLFARAENVFVITNYSGVDPELSDFPASGGTLEQRNNSQPALDNRSNPVPRTFTFGLNVGF